MVEVPPLAWYVASNVALIAEEALCWSCGRWVEVAPPPEAGAEAAAEAGAEVGVDVVAALWPLVWAGVLCTRNTMTTATRATAATASARWTHVEPRRVICALLHPTLGSRHLTPGDVSRSQSSHSTMRARCPGGMGGVALWIGGTRRRSPCGPVTHGSNASETAALRTT